MVVRDNVFETGTRECCTLLSPFHKHMRCSLLSSESLLIFVLSPGAQFLSWLWSNLSHLIFFLMALETFKLQYFGLASILYSRLPKYSRKNWGELSAHESHLGLPVGHPVAADPSRTHSVVAHPVRLARLSRCYFCSPQKTRSIWMEKVHPTLRRSGWALQLLFSALPTDRRVWWLFLIYTHPQPSLYISYVPLSLLSRWKYEMILIEDYLVSYGPSRTNCSIWV